MWSINVSKPGAGVSAVLKASSDVGRQFVEGVARREGYGTCATNFSPASAGPAKYGFKVFVFANGQFEPDFTVNCLTMHEALAARSEHTRAGFHVHLQSLQA